MDLYSDLSVDFGTGDLLENLGLCTFVTLKEFCELSLGEHGRAAELIEVKSHCVSDDCCDLLVISVLLS